MSPMQKYTPTESETLDSRRVAEGNIITISEHDDVVFIMGKDGKSGKVAVLQAGVLIPAQIWSTKEWGGYIARRIASSANGQFIGLGLLEKETV